jgi:adenylate kinase
MNPQSPDAVRPKLNDLEIKDGQLIFESVWQDLEADFGREKLRFPKEIILLGGAPGSGKGTNTAFIAKTRSLTCRPIVMSALLDSPGAKALKDAGQWRHRSRRGCVRPAGEYRQHHRQASLYHRRSNA